MIDQNNKEDIRRNSEESRGCPQGKEFPYMPHNIENASQGSHEHRGNIKANLDIDATLTRNLLFTETPGALTQGYYTSCYPYSMAICYEDMRMMQQDQRHSFGSFYYPVTQEYPFPVDISAQFMQLNMLSPGYLCDFTQEFQYFVVIYFEATCDREKKVQPQEIIEFPSVLVNSATGQLEASFQTYVRPIYHPHLTDFCKELTGIQQIQVDRGVSLTEALLMHDKWLEEKGIKHTNFAVVTWSNWDCRVMLESECKIKRIRKPPYFDRWINLRVPFHEVFGDVHCNLKEAVQLAGLTWEGRAHCGLDDARNTARLLSAIMNRGFKFSITNSLPWKSADCPRPAYGLPTDNRSVVPLTQLQESNQLAIQVNTQLQPAVASATNTCCLCGVMRSKCMIRKPGPKHGSFFFGCGNWTATRGAVCSYFEWAS